MRPLRFLVLLLPLIAACTTPPADVTVDRVDYGAQRRALAARPDFDAYATTLGDVRNSLAARKLWNDGAAADAVHLLEGWMERYPSSLAAHRLLAEFDGALALREAPGEGRKRLEASAREHRQAYEGLLASILHGTACVSMDDDCRVINIAEENAVIVAAGAQQKVRQAVTRRNGVPFDLIVMRDARGEERTFYFDIASFYRGL